MKRTSFFTLCSILLLAVFAASQESSKKTNPALPAEILGPQLIVWSQSQEPRPVPQPVPPPDRVVPPSDPQAQQGSAPAKDQAPSERQAPAAQTFTGVIGKSGSGYVLKTQDGVVYQLENQTDAAQYEGKQVKVIGNLDAKGVMLRVVSIQVTS